MDSSNRLGTSTLRTVAAGALLGLAALWAAPAAAHVTISDSHTEEGVTSITFFFDHACDGSPTTGLAVQLPDGVGVNATEEPDGWSLVSDSDTVEWEGPAIPDHEPAEFTVALTDLDTSHDQPFPTIQICEAGEAAWIDENPDAAYPAPVLSAGGEPGDHDPNGHDDNGHDEGSTTTEPEATTTTEAAEELDEEAAASTSDDNGVPVAAILIAVVVIVALAGGIWYFVRSRKAAA